MNNTIYELSDNKFIELVKESHNIGEVLFKLKLSVKGNTWGYNQVKQRMSELKLTQNDFIGLNGISTNNVSKIHPVDKENLLTENCNHSRTVLRKSLIANKLIDYKCAICGIDSWNGNPISLELDHINGINNDNRIENLRFLCPNCHSQTSTYGSKNSNIKKDKHYNLTDEDKQLIIDTYNETKNRNLVYKKLKYSKSAIKWVLSSIKADSNACNQKYVIRYDKDHNEIMRWGSIKEMSRFLLDSKETDAETIDAIRHRFLRMRKNNRSELWLNSYWEIVDGKEFR